MDPKLPDDFEQDDLSSFLSGAKAWWDKHGTQVLVVILVIALGAIGWRMYQRHQEEAFENAWGGLARAENPQIILSLAEQYDNPTFKAMAYLKAGDLLRNRAESPAPPPAASQPAASQPAPLSAADRQRLMTEAGSAYQKVIDTQKTPELLCDNARLGLAAVAESTGNWKQAAELYAAVQKDAGQRYPQLADQAAYLLKTMPDREQAPVFATAPASPPATQKK